SVVCCLVARAAMPVLFVGGRAPPSAAPFPYTTLFRSPGGDAGLDPGGLGRLAPGGRRGTHTVTWAPSSTTRPGGMWKKSVGLARSEEHTSELQSRENLVCRLLLEKKKDRRPTHCRSAR